VSRRLDRIEGLVLTLTSAGAGTSLALGVGRPLGIVLAGAAAWLDFVLIRRLATAALVRRPAVSRLVPMALAKSLLLILVPAAALHLPPTVVDGWSFAVGVSCLPLAIVLDAALPVPPEPVRT
jgi:hypothetical protein